MTPPPQPRQSPPWLDVMLFRALMGAAVSCHVRTRFRRVIYGLASCFMSQRLCVCDALVCVQMFMVGLLWDDKLSAILFYLRDMRARCGGENELTRRR